MMTTRKKKNEFFNEKYVFKFTTIVWNYLKGWFIVDALACVPQLTVMLHMIA